MRVGQKRAASTRTFPASTRWGPRVVSPCFADSARQSSHRTRSLFRSTKMLLDRPVLGVAPAGRFDIHIGTVGISSGFSETITGLPTSSISRMTGSVWYRLQRTLFVLTSAADRQVLSTRQESEIKKLRKGARAGDNLIFVFTGHGGSWKDDSDGKSGMMIIPVSGEPIFNVDLHNWLVERLPIGCKLTAIFDCCHSGAALDLQYSAEFTGGDDCAPTERVKWTSNSPDDHSAHWGGIQCLIAGGRRLGAVANVTGRRKIYSLSASRVEQNAYEHRNGITMVDLIVRLIEIQGKMSMRTLMQKLSRCYLKINTDMYRHRTRYTYTGQDPQLSSTESLEIDQDEPFIDSAILQ
ncbi:hypothetical protein EXIGLDRAFT_373193 [Exidia glandulosa HHB12029]|uniref:Peptidase C14 caspase domain-containing protein n=1 Tax=Exidia glandulosa HHB12029 TaxID=1314781 RepID=A0A165PXE6_EXIGL|nr:hypothetical protein EXIGLDRAFT_373193 [Exidia glandulosa HHB12029]